MANGIPARLNRAERAETVRSGRRFGLTVGSAFVILAALARWRDRPVASTALAVLAGLLIFGALAFPARLVPVERAWMKVGQAISKVTTPVLLGVIYFLVLTPVGLIRRAAGRSPLARSRATPSLWVARPTDGRRSDLERQF